MDMLLSGAKDLVQRARTHRTVEAVKLNATERDAVVLYQVCSSLLCWTHCIIFTADKGILGHHAHDLSHVDIS
jgi:hypothetical protein